MGRPPELAKDLVRSVRAGDSLAEDVKFCYAVRSFERNQAVAKENSRDRRPTHAPSRAPLGSRA